MEDMIWVLVPLAPFLMVLGIVWMKNQQALEEKRLNATASQSAEEAARHAIQVAELERRVQVLERIVTDKGYDVAAQIEALRDTKSHEDGAGVPLDIKRQEKA